MLRIYMTCEWVNHRIVVKMFDDRVRHIVLGHILFYMENNYVVLWYPVMKKFSLLDLLNVDIPK